MQRITARIKTESILISATILYAISVSLVFPYLRYFINNPDTVSYLSIAKEYVKGDFELAVNAYWSPLISWLLAAVYKWMGNEILAFKLLQVLIGWFALYHFIRMVQVIIHSTVLRFILVFSAVPFMISYGLLNLTPDLLFLAFVLFYIRMVSEHEFFNYRHFGLIAGVLGVLLYFSKSFGYFFFLLHFSVLFFRSYFSTKEYAFKRHLRKNYLQALIAFFLISSVWIYLISAKYGHLTISENVRLNLSKEVAAGPEKENKLPVLSGGIYKPANSSAVNAWENPGIAVQLTPLHPIKNKSDREVYKDVIGRNFLTIYYFDFRNQLGIIFLFLLVIFLFTSRRKKVFSDDYFFSMMIALAFFYFGYSLILVHSRYTWACIMLMLLLSGWLIENLFSGIKYRKIIIPFAGFFVAALSVKRPVKEILFTNDKSILFTDLLNAVIHPVATIEHTYNSDQEFFGELNEMRKVIMPNENIVSIGDVAPNRDCYTRTSLLAFLCGAKYYGQQPSDSILNFSEIDELKINHIILFSDPAGKIISPGWNISFKKDEIPMDIYSREKRF